MCRCVLCEEEFDLPKSKRKKDNLLFSNELSEDNKEIFMCQDCFEQRANSTFRQFDGDILCCNVGCGRNAMTFSKFCFMCDGKL